jgi:holo-[acyl-carrier protein] synthase
VILGLGNDLVDIRRIEQTLERFGERFMKRIFTDIEIAKSLNRALPAPTFAKRFAAKEACSKALGSGFRHGVFWRDIGVVNDASGRPSLELTGGALARLQALTPPGHRAVLHLTMTDEPPMAEAVVIIEAVKI